LAARAINLVLDAADPGMERAVHFCFGNYGGQSIQRGSWRALVDFLNSLHTDHLVLELAHRPASDLEALRDISPKIDLGIGVIDIKVNHIETPGEVAARIEAAEKKAGPGRIRWVHPDCGFWMLKRSVADLKMKALVEGRNLYLR
jgi:5-methyltetrahydropteroyltriglutamate--homocysteine methyltransferase